MNKPFDPGPARVSCHPFGSLDVNGMKRFLSVLDVKTDRIDSGVSAGKRVCNRSVVVDVGPDGLKLRIIRTNLSVSPIRTP